MNTVFEILKSPFARQPVIAFDGEQYGEHDVFLRDGVPEPESSSYFATYGTLEEVRAEYSEEQTWLLEGLSKPILEYEKDFSRTYMKRALDPEKKQTGGGYWLHIQWPTHLTFGEYLKTLQGVDLPENIDFSELQERICFIKNKTLEKGCVVSFLDQKQIEE